MKLKQGIHPDIPMSDYLADPCEQPSLSAGCAKTLIERSPLHAHAAHPRFGGRRDTGSKASDRGSAAHQLLLGGSQTIDWCDVTNKAGEVVTDYKTKAAQEFRDKARAEGRTPMLEKDREHVEAMTQIAAVELRSAGLHFGGDGTTEQTMIWCDDGVWCRARPDWISADGTVIIDYKTTENADAVSWIRRVLFATGGEYTAAHYLRGLDHLGKVSEVRRSYVFMVQEVEPPYEYSMIELDEEVIALGQKKMNKARELWKSGLASGKWPGYSRSRQWAMLPTWTAWDWETRDAMGSE